MTRQGWKRLFIGGAGVLALAAAAAGWLHWRHALLRAAPRDFTARELPVPYPRPGLDELQAATEAVRSGEALYNGRYGCKGCHGVDLSGGNVQGPWPFMTSVGANITPGGVTKDYTSRDWDALIRHGIRPDGRAALMPVMEIYKMSDQELSDLIAFVRSMPALSTPRAESRIHLPGMALVVFGWAHYSADEVDHDYAHPERPPDDLLALGEHIAHTCRVCHREMLNGGPVAVGAPNWPPAANLTKHPSGLSAWTEADFVQLLRTGVRPDGTEVNPVMPWQAVKDMPASDIHALWVYLQSLPEMATGR
jgi:mono/diheme cytochrome c family protein